LEKRDFITGEELGGFELGRLLDRAAALKAGRRERLGADSLAGRSIALVFERPSTRTRISFDVGVAELGGHPVVLRGDEMQLSRGESIGDTALVLSRYVDAIVIRSGSHQNVAALAAEADVPVINALTPLHHPCQVLADLLTLRERCGSGPAGCQIHQAAMEVENNPLGWRRLQLGNKVLETFRARTLLLVESSSVKNNGMGWCGHIGMLHRC